MGELGIDMVYSALKNAKWDKKIKRVDMRYGGNPRNSFLEEEMNEIEARKEEMGRSLRQTLKEIKVGGKMTKRVNASPWYTWNLRMEDDTMTVIEVREEEMRKSLVHTLKELEVNEKMNGGYEFSSLEELIGWAKGIYGTGFE